jgi:hypothetical protein
MTGGSSFPTVEELGFDTMAVSIGREGGQHGYLAT